MFAKLKQKIQEEGVDLSKGFSSGPLGSVSSSSKRGSGETTPIRSPASPVTSRRARTVGSSFDATAVNSDSRQKSNRSNSTTSDLASESTYHVSDYSAATADFSINGSPSALPKKPPEAPEDFESKVKQLSKALKDEIKQREKVEHLLEKCREDMNKKSEEKDQEWRKKYESLEKHCGDLTAKLDQENGWREKYIRDHEAAEELEDFQTQEVAKVKHLLLMSQQEIQDLETKFKEAQVELENAKQNLASHEEEAVCLRREYSKLKEECSLLTEQASKDSETVNELKCLKETMGKKVLELNCKLEENESKYSIQEMLLSGVNNDYASLKHAHEVHLAKSAAVLLEKTNTVEHLEDRVKTLERRLCENDLGEDEKLKALTSERDSLEAKLEESRQHLNEIKSGWSEKINCLERQISNLNQKMAEDREDASRAEEEVRAEKSRLELQIVDLLRQLEDGANSNRQLSGSLEELEIKRKKEKSELEQRVDLAYKDKEAAIKLLEERIQGFELRIANMESERRDDTAKFHSRIAQLESRNTEHLSKENDLEKDINLLIEEKSRAEKKCESLESQIGDYENQLSTLNSEINLLNAKIANLEAELASKVTAEDELKEEAQRFEGEKLSWEQERIEVAAKTEELANEITRHKEEISRLQQQSESLNIERQQGMHRLQQELDNAVKDKDALRETVVKLEASLDDDHIEKSDRVLELKSQVADLENQLIDRSKTIKLQQQRLGDIKKTLQRELKFQNPGDATNGDAVDKDALASFNSAMSKSGVELSVVHFGHGRSSSLSEKLGDINFRYIKHVILKFMTGRDYEAQQLIKAIGVFLEFTAEEERLVRETLEWRTSWFGTKPQMSRPQVGNRTVMS